MSVQSKSGNKNVSKKKTGSDLPFLDQSPLVNQLLADIQQIASDLYTTPSLDHDGKANLTKPLQATAVPVGSIIPHYDFGGLLALDLTVWAYCNGDTKTIAGIVAPQILPDLSGRYLVGYSTPGGTEGNVSMATPGALGLAGQVGHLTNISHGHPGSTANSHTHDVAEAYTNGAFLNRRQFRMFKGTFGGGTYWQLGGATTVSTPSGTFWNAFDDFGSAPSGTIVQGDKFVSSTASANGVTVGTGGSTTQNIQPRSVQVRFIMRIK